jgi:hypothetical protein
MRNTSAYLRGMSRIFFFQYRKMAEYLGSVFEPSCRMPDATATMRTRVGLMLPAVMLMYSDGMWAYLRHGALRDTTRRMEQGGS